MTNIFKGLSILIVLAFISCGGGEKKEEKEAFKIGGGEEQKEVVEIPTEMPKGVVIDMDNKGIGPIKELTLPAEIDQTMATAGAAIYKSKCTACHKTDKKFIGPAPTGIFERRSPEWIMNMILNPEEMTQKDPIAKALLIEFNGAPMANQGLTEEDARKVLEYFRTL